MGNASSGTSPFEQVTHREKVAAMAARIVHYAVAAVLLRLADEGARVALVLLALERTGSAAVGGLLVAALLVPHVVAAGPVGSWADRARRPAAVVAVAGAGFGAALCVAVPALDAAPLALVVLVLIAGGCCGPAITGGLSSRLPSLLARAAMPRAFGVDALTYDVAGMLGPAVAGIIAGRASAGAATLALGGAAGLGAATVAALPARRGSPGSAPPAARTEARPRWAGLAALAHDRVLGAVTAATSVAQLGFGALPVVVAVLATRHAAPSIAGLLLTALTAGSLLGSLLWIVRPARPSRAPWVVMAGLVAAGLPLAASAALPSIVAVAALFALSGVANGPLVGALLLTRERWAPAAARTQVFTLGAGAKITFTAAGSALAGLAAGWPSPVQLLLVAACPVLAGAAGAAVLRHPVRRRASGRGSESTDGTSANGRGRRASRRTTSAPGREGP
jgi:MFS family permease